MKEELKSKITLLTPTGKITVPVDITYTYDVVNGFERNQNCVISLTYNGKEYKGVGSDYIDEYTVSDLEKNLPDDVRVQCCLACRHGNMCPYGNSDGEVFCTKDLMINSKEDVCNLFDYTDPFEERSVNSLHYCEDFKFQSDDFYTYNSYLHSLRKKKLTKIPYSESIHTQNTPMTPTDILVFERMAFYINNCADFITSEMIKNTMDDCGVSELEAYRILISGAVDLFERRDIMASHIRRMFTCLDAELYKNDPYMKTIKISEVLGDRWALRRLSYRPYEAFVYNDPVTAPDGCILPQIGFFREEFSFPAVLQDGREWMLITPNEIETMKAPIAHARGKVVTYGLGLGYYAFMASEKEEVESVTVVELDREVINIFKKHILPQFPHREKIKIVCANALEYAKGESEADCVFADIWHDPSDGIPLMRELKKQERPDCRYDYWIEDTMKLYM